MKIGIVGSEAAKFTSFTKLRAMETIRELLINPGITTVVSGACHLGGIDIWAADVGHELGLEVIEHPPDRHCWDAYRLRNLKIVHDSDKVVCITVKELPPDYTGMRFKLCYHCKTNDHVKSGGCWTMHRARLVGKQGELIIL
jgi:hypothetical protein